MTTLILAHGPKLTCSRHSEAGVDVTNRAHEFLFDDVTLEPDVTLADLFGLLEAAPQLRQVFRQDFAEEFCAEARKGPTKPHTGEYDPDGVELLELYAVWSFDTAEQAYTARPAWSFRGMGFVLNEAHEPYLAGSRIAWGLDFIHVRDLLTLPLRVDPVVHVCEGDMDSLGWGKTLWTDKQPHITLGEVIHAVLWELSFHGAPTEVETKSEELKEVYREVVAGEVECETFDLDDLFIKSDEPRMAAMFSSLGNNEPKAISARMRSIPDDDNASEAFAAMEVLVQPEHMQLTGRQFRRAFRKAA